MLIPSRGVLHCEGRNGPGVYRYVLTREEASPFFPVGNARFPRWKCLVYDDADSTNGRVHVFQADAVQVESNVLIQSEMHRTGERGGEHSAKGIPDAVIDLFHRASRATVVSSTNAKASQRLEPEFRTDDAGTVWKRLESKGRAKYDERTHRYVFVPAAVAVANSSREGSS